VKLPIGLMATALVAGIVHEATPPRICTPEESCPEPEQQPTDMKEPGRPKGPTGPTLSYVTTGPTARVLMGVANIVEGSDGVSGIDTVSAAPQSHEDIQPRIFPPTV
jgi:hypothetical protein